MNSQNDSELRELFDSITTELYGDPERLILFEEFQRLVENTYSKGFKDGKIEGEILGRIGYE